MIRLAITVPSITEVLAAGYSVIRVYTDVAEDGTFTTLDGTITLVSNTSGYSYVDTDGTVDTWYKTAYYGSSPGESDKSDAQKGGTVDAYCTALSVRQELAAGSGENAIGPEHDNVLWNMCLEASRMIDRFKKVGDGAYMATASTVRYFSSEGGLRQRIDCAVSISEVAVEEIDGAYTIWATTDYFTWPFHGDEPIMRLDVNTKGDGTKSVWTYGPQRVKVTGVWGISTVAPSIIERACKIQAARWYKRAQQGWADTGGLAEMGELRYTKDMDPEVKTMLQLAYPRRARL
jgi:hypothetical protein